MSIAPPPLGIAPHPALAARLSAPPLSADLTDLAGQWRTTTLQLLCEPPAPIEPGVWLSHAIRGAWGNALMRHHGTKDVMPAALPTAFEVFFGTHARTTRKHDVPKPYVIAAERLGPNIAVTLTLFGFANRWRLEAGEALIEALTEGLSVGDGSGLRRRWRILAAEWWQKEGLDVPASSPLLVVVFGTPWRSGPRGALGVRLEDFAMSLLERASGLARWHGCRLEVDWSAWRTLCHRLRFSNVDLHGVAWTRRSGRQGGRLIPEKGLIGRFAIDQPPPAFLPAVAIGQTCHAGAEASLGLGRFTAGGLN